MRTCGCTIILKSLSLWLRSNNIISTPTLVVITQNVWLKHLINHTTHMGIFQWICVTFTPLASHFSIGLSYQSKCYTSPPWVQHSPPLEPYSTIGWANMGVTNPTCNCHVYHLSSSDTTCYESRSFDFNFWDLVLWELMINTCGKSPYVTSHTHVGIPLFDTYIQGYYYFGLDKLLNRWEATNWNLVRLDTTSCISIYTLTIACSIQ